MYCWLKKNIHLVTFIGSGMAKITKLSDQELNNNKD